MGFLQRCIVRGVLGVVGRPKLTLAIAAAALVACATLAYFRLDISTDQNKLFSPRAKFFADYLAYVDKFPENEAAYVVIERADRSTMPPIRRWTAAADAVAARVAALSTEHVRSVDVRVPLDRLGDQGLLFEEPDVLDDRVAEVRRFIPLIRILAERPTLLTRVLGPTVIDRFLGSQIAGPKPDAAQAAFVGEVVRSWNLTLAARAEAPEAAVRPPDLAAVGATSPRDLGYYYEPDATDRSNALLLVRVYPTRTFDSLEAVLKPVEAIRGAVRGVSADFPEFRIGLTGRPVLEADEMRTSDRDSHRAEAVALTVVFIGLAVGVWSVWRALAAEISLAVAIGWTFGWAELAVGHLNLLSLVFLIALIGIGMDYLVQILIRYGQEASRHESPRAIWARVFRHVGPPINTACLGAAGAFLVAVFTDFRGAAELGIIAGGGLLLCLLSGYTVLPALLTLFPGRNARKRGAGSTALAAAPGRAPSGGWRLVLPVVWAALLVVGVTRFAPRTGFNPNLLELQAPRLESVQLVRKLQTFSAVVLSKDLDVLRRARDAVKGLPTVAGTDSILKAHDNAAWLAGNAKLPGIQWAEPARVRPADLNRLGEKARSLTRKLAEAPAVPARHEATERLEEFAARMGAASPEIAETLTRRLSAWQEAFLTQLKATLRQFSPGPPRVDDELPPALRKHYVADDGTAALYIYPTHDLWDRANLAPFVREVEAAVRSVPGAPAPTGIAVDIYHTTGSIERSFYTSAAYALALIFLLVLIDLRNLLQTLLAISVLALGLPMLVSLMGLLRVDWNFANFFGLPILIGAGHEYGVFMVHRYREALHDPRRYWRRWDASDKALLLCAYVTCSSFGFFWLLANHRGLKSLGLVMALGTACIYLATLLVVRPLLLWRLAKVERRRSPAQHT